MANRWFSETFLSSLYAQAGATGGACVRITQKQMEVCARHMDITPHGYKPYQWEGRAVSLVAGKVGGCISFGRTAEEEKAWGATVSHAAMEKNAKAWARQRTKRPERYAAEIARLRTDLADCIAEAGESDDPAWAQEMQAKAQEIAARIALYESTVA